MGATESNMGMQQFCHIQQVTDFSINPDKLNAVGVWKMGNAQITLKNSMNSWTQKFKLFN